MYPIPNDIELQLVNTPTALLKDVKFIQEVAMQNSGFAYMIAKRMNHLQAQRAAATRVLRSAYYSFLFDRLHAPDAVQRIKRTGISDEGKDKPRFRPGGRSYLHD